MEAVTAPFISQEALDEYASHAEDPADLEGQPGRIRGTTIFWWIVFAVGAVPTLISAQSASRSLDSFFTLTLVGPVALTGFLAGMVMLRTDLLTPSLRDRSRPELAVRCYLRTLGFHQWSRAFLNVARIAVGESLDRPTISALDVGAETVEVRQPRDLARYWSPILASGVGFDRRLSRLKIRETHSEGPLHYLRVELRVSIFPSWAMLGFLLGVFPILPLILLTTERHTITFEIPVVKHKSQWWVAAAGIPTHEGNIASASSLPRARAIESHRRDEP